MTLSFFQIDAITVRTGSEFPIQIDHVNWLAVLTSAVVAFLIGGLWYGPLFSKPWIRAQGWNEARVEELKKQMNPAKFFGGMLVSYLVLATVLAAVITSIAAQSLAIGMGIGLLAWVAVICVTLTHQLASGRHVNAWLIDSGCELVYLVAMGGILGAWR